MTALLAFDAVSCIRGDRRLFERLSFTLDGGEALWLCGPNGVGKSSLLRLASGLLPIAAGSLHRPAQHALADERLALDAERPLGAALAFWALMDGTTAAARDAALAAMALTALVDVPVAYLSTGQRKRAVLARTIASGARLWLLDEPGNGLDTASLGHLRSAIAVHRAQGGALLFASHFDLELPDQRTLTMAAPQ